MKTIALVGCGRISKRHREAISVTKGLDIAVVCDIDKERAKTAAQEIGCEWVTDYRQIREVDYVAVLTPSGLHPVHASEISESTDATHIIVEKPLSLTVREAHELFRRVEAAGKILLPVYQNRYNP
ncbi:MAG: Gfo/Idh/MocA family oxidoreductase, partial [Spirochaetaceae bacterium]|nr:Gfo/Idh/MocA family oxidoreductase [Spirochaetaceae bacterium]